MSKHEKPYKINLNGRQYEFERDNHVVHTYRDSAYQDADFIRYFDEKKQLAHRIFGMQDMARWMAGIAFKGNGNPYIPVSTARRTFYEHFGWNSDTIMTDEPEPDDKEAWITLIINKDLHQDGSYSLPDEDD